jgi:ABC-type glycerol-3-phosphate transport system substrate-binding protein
MKFKLASLALAAGLATALPAHAQVEIQWWHSMSGQLGAVARRPGQGFNDSQKEYKVVPVFKGTYPSPSPPRSPPSAPATRRTSSRSSRWARPA